MTCDSEDIGKQLRILGWRQGSIVEGQDLHKLGFTNYDLGVLISQSCDVVNSSEDETEIEIVLCRRTEKARPDCLLGRNPRHLDLNVQAPAGDTIISINIRDRRMIRKADLVGSSPSRALMIGQQDTKLIARWISKRYTRAAWPDAFQLRLVNRKLNKLVKGSDGKVISGVWFMLDPRNDELEEDTNYRLSVWLSVPSKYWEKTDSLRSAQNFEDKLRSILRDCKGIHVDEIEIRNEKDISLDDMHLFDRYDWDFRSHAEVSNEAIVPSEAI